MSRSAEDLLEFDKLRDLLRLRTTCAPGRRAVESLGFGRDRAVLESDFARIRSSRVDARWTRTWLWLPCGPRRLARQNPGPRRRARIEGTPQRRFAPGDRRLVARAIPGRCREISAARGARRRGG